MDWPPWLLRWVLLTLALFVQLLIVADLLEALDDDPNLELDYVLIFGVTILYLAAAVLVLLFSWFTTFRLFLDVRREAVAERIATSSREDIDRREALARDLRIVAGDAVVDTLLLVPLVVFIALLIDNLQRDNDGEPLHDWQHVFVWLFIVLVVLAVVIVVTAVRTCGEERLRRGDMGSGQWASSAFGDVVVGVSVDGTLLENARARRADKSENYVADANYHAIPCAYLCAPQLTGNCCDFLLNWSLLATLLYLTVLALQLGVYLEHRPAWHLQPLLVPGWVLAALVLVFGVAAFLLMCFDPRVAGTKALPRFSVVQKMNVAFIAALGALLLAIFAALLVEKIDRHETRDWWAIFTPLLVFTGIVLIASACYGSALRRPTPQYVDITATSAAAALSTTLLSTSARANVARRDLTRNINPNRTSVWGV